mmetsp:Transcript_3110/g.8217  ORF Transcript_3110/g.8217 Transcript_3110/m.8217 type:complete len:145 (+) Transcript_3110:131-565(+)
MDAEQGDIPLLQSNNEQEQQEHWTKSSARKLYGSLSHCALGAFLGLLTAIGLKTIGTSIAIAVLLIFVAINVLAYYGYVNVNWRSLGKNVSQTVRARLDLNTDRGIELQDVGGACKRIGVWCLSFGLPSVLSFSVGFWLGWCVL